MGVNKLIYATVDVNEPPWAQSFDFAPAVTSIPMPLPAGDYRLVCSDEAVVLVERKTPNDLLNTLKEKRLEYQANKLLNNSKWPYLLITEPIRYNGEGKVLINGKPTGWEFNSVMGKLEKIQEMGVTVTYCMGDTYLKEALIRIAKRDRSNGRVEPKRVFVPPEKYQEVILAFDGVGEKTLEKLEAAFPNEPIAMLIAMLGPEGNDIIGEYQVGRNRATMMMWADTKLGLTLYDTPVIIEKGAKPYE